MFTLSPCRRSVMINSTNTTSRISSPVSSRARSSSSSSSSSSPSSPSSSSSSPSQSHKSLQNSKNKEKKIVIKNKKSSSSIRAHHHNGSSNNTIFATALFLEVDEILLSQTVGDVDDDATTSRLILRNMRRRESQRLENVWIDRFREARNHWVLHGHLQIKAEDDKAQLARWITYQRKLFREDKLTPSRYEMCNFLGMFDVEKMPLIQWKQEKLWPALKKDGCIDSKFLQTQRRLYRDGKLSNKKIKELTSLGVELTELAKPKQQQRPKQSWEETFEELILFKEINALLDKEMFKKALPVKLRRWLYNQKNTKSSEKKKLLIENGFKEYISNRTTRVSWDTRFTELRQFHNQYGHCNVPVTYRLNRPLGNWIATQRKAYRKGKLSRSRKEALTNLGFEFEPLKSWYRNVNVNDLANKVSISWMGRAAPAYEEKQKLVFETLQANFSDLDMRFNHRLGKLGSIKPDIVIEMKDDWAMVIEVDEFQHNKYEQDDEDERLEALRDYFNIPLKVVRFNPDPVSLKDERDFEERLDLLVEFVRQSKEVAPLRDVEIDYVCFD